MNSFAQPLSFVSCDSALLTVEQWRQVQCSLRLSLRELQITQHIFDDDKSECIAQELGISVHTVNTYLQRLYSKLDVRSRVQLVLRILKVYLDGMTSECESDIDYNLLSFVMSRELGPM